MQSSYIRNYLLPVLVLMTSAAFIFLVGGCGGRDANTSPAAPIKSEAAPAKPGPARSAPKPTPEVSKPIKIEKIDEEPKPKIEISQSGVTLKWMDLDKGTVKMVANAREIQAQEETRVGTLMGLSAKLYEAGKVSTTMSAPKVSVDSNNRILTATGGVLLKSLDRKTVVTAQRVRWFANQQKIIGVGKVKVTSELGTMEGAAFVADTALKTVNVKNSTEGLDY